MNFIKQIFDEKTDEKTHLQFQKFSRGKFINRALLEIKNSKGKYTLKTSPEFANYLVGLVAEKIGNKKTRITGAIISTQKLEGRINFKEKKQFQGVKRYLIDEEKTGEEIQSLLKEFPLNFFALSFKDEESETILKIKPKAPKSGKPGKNKEVKASFCTLKTSDKKIIKDFLFEKSEFKVARVNHTFLIEEIIFPKGEKDFSKIREFAKRKGKIIRRAVIDEKEYNSEKEFAV